MGLDALYQDTGVHLRKDVLQSLGDRACIYSSPGEGGLLVGTTLVVDVKDGEKLSAVQDRLLTVMRGAMPPGDPWSPSISSYSFNGYEIHTLNLPDPEIAVCPSWCLTDEVLLVALYPQSIKAYLSRDKLFQSLASRPEVAAALAADQRALALWYVDSRSVFEIAYTIVVGAELLGDHSAVVGGLAQFHVCVGQVEPSGLLELGPGGHLPGRTLSFTHRGPEHAE